MIISKVNSFLHEATISLVEWLNSILPKVSDDWWESCVLPSLSYSQREEAEKKQFAKLSEFDLAALLRITNKSWYDMRTVAYLPTKDRELVREMIAVRNNWAHCSSELPGKDTIINDLKTISEFINQIGGNQRVYAEIESLITQIEKPNSIAVASYDGQIECPTLSQTTPNELNEIQLHSMVYLVSAPETKGFVLSIKDLGTTKQYEVFVNNAPQHFFFGQIAPVKEKSDLNWVGIDDVRSYLAAYQINRPSSQNLYSLNSARIDFVPYQFRPALKMIHADEPRILIADSVGVGKTIEAGLIIKELEARSELERIVVICPRPLVAERKWELEMKQRFDEEFEPVDGATLRQILSDTDRDGEWPIEYSKIIIPYSIMDSKVYNGEKEKRIRCFGLTELNPEPVFDLVIVDEAHHIRNGSMEKEKAFAYKCTKYFCDHAKAVVMLTATPLQTGDNDLFTLLNLLRPDIVIDPNTFDMMSRPNAYISQAVRIIRTAEAGWPQKAISELRNVQKTQWGENVIAENPLYYDIMIRLDKDKINREERVKLISDIESLHSFSTMINRTRRRDIQDFCVRRPITLSVEFTDYQRMLHNELLNFEHQALALLHDVRAIPFMMSTIRRQAASCIFGLAPHIRDIINRRLRDIYDDPDVEFSDFDDINLSNDISSLAKLLLELADNLPDEDPKFDKTLEVIQRKKEMQNNKIMLFSTFRHTLHYLKQRLEELEYRVGQIDGSVKDEERYRLKERFEYSKDNPEAIDILLFTEVGSEGLDYQFCDTMINYDLPWNPMRIEQRIGRIDRRGQQSEAVNIYNVITENTVDADIYYRCLMRIGVFEKSIGDCEEILGTIASKIDKTALDARLTEQERKAKLEQIADNEVRKVQELTKLEEAEKELFGFDLTEFTTSQEIRQAENPWLNQYSLQKLIENYLIRRVEGNGKIHGESMIKNLRLSSDARVKLLEDFRKLPGKRNALRRTWENYLKGNKPNHAITFDSDAARKDIDCFFITAMHPLAKQAAESYDYNEVQYLKLKYYTSAIPAGNYLFSVYAWDYLGFNTFTKIVAVCENDRIANEIPSILEDAVNEKNNEDGNHDWSALEEKHARIWQAEKEKHRTSVRSILNFKLESLLNTHQNRIRFLEQQISDTADDNIRQMRQSELNKAKERNEQKVTAIKEMASRADIFTKPLVNGILTIVEE